MEQVANEESQKTRLEFLREDLSDFIASFTYNNLQPQLQRQHKLNDIQDYLNSETKIPTEIEQAMRLLIFPIHGFVFPNFTLEEKVHFANLSKGKGVIFKNCTFECDAFDLVQVSTIYFEDCTFNCNQEIPRVPVSAKEHSKELFSNCLFKEKIKLGNHIKQKIQAPSIFKNCRFLGKLSMINLALNNIFSQTSDLDSALHLSGMKLDSCTFSNDLDLRDIIGSGNLEFVDVIVNGDLITSGSLFGSLHDKKLNIEGSTDLSGTSFNQARLLRSSFKGYFSLENSSFHGTVSFPYTSFHGAVNCRGTCFQTGLHIEKTNFTETPNFLGAIVNHQDTSRETYRVIKHSFEKVGNNIEARKYYVKEMRKLKDELRNEPLSQTKFIFYLNWYTSKYGSSYIRPILWLIVIAFINYLVLLGYEYNTLYSVEALNSRISDITGVLNEFATLLPFSKFLGENENLRFVSLVFYILYASLIWQCIAAIKRYSK